jgi:hypothetical protein
MQFIASCLLTGIWHTTTLIFFPVVIIISQYKDHKIAVGFFLFRKAARGILPGWMHKITTKSLYAANKLNRKLFKKHYLLYYIV